MSIHRLYKLYDLASPDERQAGRAWYRIACEDVTELAIKHETTTKIVAGIMAALSPNTTWSTNKHDTARVLSVALAPYDLGAYEECTVSTYNRNKAKAFAISELDWNTTGEPLDILGGPKVQAFYRNLIGDTSALTLDSHAYNAFCGFRATGSDLPGLKAGISRDARKAYIRAADIKHETVSGFQAIIWLTWKARIDAGKVAGYSK